MADISRHPLQRRRPPSAAMAGATAPPTGGPQYCAHVFKEQARSLSPGLRACCRVHALPKARKCTEKQTTARTHFSYDGSEINGTMRPRFSQFEVSSRQTGTFF